MQAYRIWKATQSDADVVRTFYNKHKNTISNQRKINQFLDGTTEIDLLFISKVRDNGDLGVPFAGCSVSYLYLNGIKYGSCNSGVVNICMRRKGVSKVLYRACEVMFRSYGCEKVIKMRNIFQKHINLEKLAKQNWKITVEGSMVIMEKDL